MEVHPLDPVKNSKPKNIPFRQQTMRAYKPVPTVRSAVLIFSILGIIFLVVGIVVLVLSSEIVEVRERYDNLGACDDTEWDNPGECTIDLDIDEDMKEPIFFYYELTNFYQNHRRYVKSKNYEQLNGEDMDKGELESCEPVVTMDELGFTPDTIKRYNSKFSIPESEFDDTPANPCGLIARSYFNDTYVLKDSNGNEIEIQSDDIAWDSDKDKRFSNSDNMQKQWIDLEDGNFYIERFIVWMRTSGLPNFRKLWGRIEQDLDKGRYKVEVKSFYDVSDFDGEKYIVLSTANALGGKNDFLGIAYIVVGALSIILAIIFCVRGYVFPKPQDLHYN